jgi:acetyl-CoA C-acetyltransferase
MPEAVIVATARSPIGRAGKGSLIDIRADDLAAQMLRAVMDKVPQLPAGAPLMRARRR